MTGKYTSSTTIVVTWGGVPTDQQHGIIVSYTVIYKLSSKSTEFQVDVFSPTRKADITNLQKFTEYIIQVKAATVKGFGARSASISVRTDQDSK